MGKQYRGCSRLVYSLVTEGESQGVPTTTYGTPKEIVGVKAISREIAADNEEVWADNQLQEKVYAGSKITRSFDTIKLAPDVEAELLGQAAITISGTKKAYATDPTGDTRPYIAVGYALHDGDIDRPCEVVWAFRGKVNSITKTSNTIDAGTGSEGQTIEIEFIAPVNKFTTTGKRNLDISLPITSDNAADVDDWFDQVVTPDNAATILA